MELLPITTNGPFSLLQALRFLNEFPPAGAPRQYTRYRAAHLIQGRPWLVELCQTRPQDLTLRLLSDTAVADMQAWDAAAGLCGRIFSIDSDSTPFFSRLAARDGVLARLQGRCPGLRPVLFGSLFECLCWVLIVQRQGQREAVLLKDRLKALTGPMVKALGQTWQAFPSPEHLLHIDPRRDVKLLLMHSERLEQLLALARRGAAGELDEGRVLRMPVDEACQWLARSPGVGLGWAEFALARGAGHPDLFPKGDRQIRSGLERFYGKSYEDLPRLTQPWAGYRSWVAFLLRVAYQREVAAPAAQQVSAAL